MAVVIPFVKGDAIKANLCLTFPPNFARGEGGADSVERSVVDECCDETSLMFRNDGIFRSLNEGT